MYNVLLVCWVLLMPMRFCDVHQILQSKNAFDEAGISCLISCQASYQRNNLPSFNCSCYSSEGKVLVKYEALIFFFFFLRDFIFKKTLFEKLQYSTESNFSESSLLADKADHISRAHHGGHRALYYNIIRWQNWAAGKPVCAKIQVSHALQIL